MSERAVLTIRPIEAGDEAEWRRLWTGYLSFYETSLDESVFRISFQRLLSPDRNEFRGLLALADGQAVGLVHFLFHRHMWRVENTCYLQDLYADPEHRGHGIGRALIEAVYKAADEEGCPSVYWLTQDFNSAARKLYDRIGTLTPFIRYNRVLS